MRLLLSIHPEHAAKIFAGTKRFEFRKLKPRDEVTRVVVYVTSPEARVIGDFAVGRVLVASPTALWKLTRDSAGLSRDALYRYFAGCIEGVAIEVASVRRFKRPKRISEYVSDGRAPQGFRYLRGRPMQRIG